MLRRLMLGLTLVLWLVLPPTWSWGLSLETLPNPQPILDSWVLDQAEMLSSSTKTTLDQEIAQLYRETGSKIVIVTLPDIPLDQTAHQVALELFDRWAVDDHAKGLGVLMLVVQSDRAVEMHTGIRSTVLLPDQRLSWVLNQRILPYFRQAKFDQGMLSGTTALIKRLHSPPEMPQGSKILLIAIGLSGFFMISRHIALGWGKTFAGVSEDNFRMILQNPQGIGSDGTGSHGDGGTGDCGYGDIGGSSDGGDAGGHW